VVFFSTSSSETTVPMPLDNISAHEAWTRCERGGPAVSQGAQLCVDDDVYSHTEMPAGTAVGGGVLAPTLQPHDSVFYCIRPAAKDGSCDYKDVPC
jgi:hypothetical protein